MTYLITYLTCLQNSCGCFYDLQHNGLKEILQIDLEKNFVLRSKFKSVSWTINYSQIYQGLIYTRHIIVFHFLSDFHSKPNN